MAPGFANNDGAQNCFVPISTAKILTAYLIGSTEEGSVHSSGDIAENVQRVQRQRRTGLPRGISTTVHA